MQVELYEKLWNTWVHLVGFLHSPYRCFDQRFLSYPLHRTPCFAIGRLTCLWGRTVPSKCVWTCLGPGKNCSSPAMGFKPFANSSKTLNFNELEPALRTSTFDAMPANSGSGEGQHYTLTAWNSFSFWKRFVCLEIVQYVQNREFSIARADLNLRFSSAIVTHTICDRIYRYTDMSGIVFMLVKVCISPCIWSRTDVHTVANSLFIQVKAFSICGPLPYLPDTVMMAWHMYQ